ncbi:MAG: polymerase sigma factor, sigma-70 family [Parcubacteria group bacterium]|nr:polymerase sigma factor, sigma-70 family [Parcubacteria group bacterium]
MDNEENKDHFLEVYDRYSDDIFRFCVLKVSSRAVAEDLTQEVFMRFWQQLRAGTEIGNERALLYAMARNLVIDWYRKRKEQSLDMLQEEGFEFANDDHTSIKRNAEMREVLDVIKDLDEPSREALTLRFVEGFSPMEIAALSGETANAVSVRINRALKKVQEHLHVHD